MSSLTMRAKHFFDALKQLDEHSKIVKEEFFRDRGELLAGLIKGKTSDELTEAKPSGCLFMSTDKCSFYTYSKL